MASQRDFYPNYPNSMEVVFTVQQKSFALDDYHLQGVYLGGELSTSTVVLKSTYSILDLPPTK